MACGPSIDRPETGFILSECILPLLHSPRFTSHQRSLTVFRLSHRLHRRQTQQMHHCSRNCVRLVSITYLHRNETKRKHSKDGSEPIALPASLLEGWWHDMGFWPGGGSEPSVPRAEHWHSRNPDLVKQSPEEVRSARCVAVPPRYCPGVVSSAWFRFGFEFEFVLVLVFPNMHPVSPCSAILLRAAFGHKGCCYSDKYYNILEKIFIVGRVCLIPWQLVLVDLSHFFFFYLCS